MQFILLIDLYNFYIYIAFGRLQLELSPEEVKARVEEIMEMISKRSIVMGEDHRVKLDDTPKRVLSNYGLLMELL